MDNRKRLRKHTAASGPSCFENNIVSRQSVNVIIDTGSRVLHKRDCAPIDCIRSSSGAALNASPDKTVGNRQIARCVRDYLHSKSGCA